MRSVAAAMRSIVRPCSTATTSEITDTNIAPAGDPYESIVSLGLPTNVDTVIVDGRVLRRAGTFTAFDHAKIVAEARVAAVGLRDRAKWPT